jgi:hypothetical protein
LFLANYGLAGLGRPSRIPGTLVATKSFEHCTSDPVPDTGVCVQYV